MSMMSYTVKVMSHSSTMMSSTIQTSRPNNEGQACIVPTAYRLDLLIKSANGYFKPFINTGTSSSNFLFFHSNDGSNLAYRYLKIFWKSFTLGAMNIFGEMLRSYPASARNFTRFLIAAIIHCLSRMFLGSFSDCGWLLLLPPKFPTADGRPYWLERLCDLQWMNDIKFNNSQLPWHWWTGDGALAAVKSRLLLRQR